MSDADTFSAWVEANGLDLMRRGILGPVPAAPGELTDAEQRFLKLMRGQVDQRHGGEVTFETLDAAFAKLSELGFIPEPKELPEEAEAKAKAAAEVAVARFAEFAQAASTEQIKERAQTDSEFREWMGKQVEAEVEYKEQSQEVFNPLVDARTPAGDSRPLLFANRYGFIVRLGDGSYLLEDLPRDGRDIGTVKTTRDPAGARQFDSAGAARRAHRLAQLGLKATVHDCHGEQAWPARR